MPRSLLTSLSILLSSPVRAHLGVEPPAQVHHDVPNAVTRREGAGDYADHALLRQRLRLRLEPFYITGSRGEIRLVGDDDRWAAREALRVPGGVGVDGMVGVVGGLENAVASHLTDFVDNVRLSLEEHVWNGLCHRAWLRILNCATDVYNIRGIDQDDGNERKEEQKEERTKSAFYTEPRLKNESVEFLYAFDSGYTNPLCFD